MTKCRHYDQRLRQCRLSGLAAPSGFCAACSRYDGPLRGLGDAVHAVADPVAAAMDAVARTNVRRCHQCHGRRVRWNQTVPFD